MLELILAPLAVGLIIVAMNAYFGLHIIRRGVIFVDLAFAQIAALGSTVGLLLGAHVGSPASWGLTFGFTVLGAAIFSLTRMEDSIVPQEAIIGIAYVVASALVILLTSFTAEGAEHVKETLTGSLIWTTWPTVGIVAIAYLVIGAFHFLTRDRMRRITFYPERADRLRLWDFIFYLTFGVAITFSVTLAGVLLIFSTLVIPATIAFLFTARFNRALVIAWLSGAVALVAGLWGSVVWDVTTGPLLVVAFGVALIVAFMIRPLLGERASLRDAVGREPGPVVHPKP
ncbi:MAG: metal ABC transporter permease [Gemmatimonadetes bacterium]|nr:metal ABC transporter permease [Gemmatimonadota bacterium]NIQ54071.1 metal ABC transporter permease [Gemmatimonadota bacterium]NIU74261.1 metal ABC transporter permease [Gammaproteobacteria bacterium]NIX44281.1 metal ABC transporter permease [Gemmatimonadota bacterium]NIY08498.1 metal ABC transporter permease [Gemmatimonadota bacterium]